MASTDGSSSLHQEVAMFKPAKTANNVVVRLGLSHFIIFRPIVYWLMTFKSSCNAAHREKKLIRSFNIFYTGYTLATPANT